MGGARFLELVSKPVLGFSGSGGSNGSGFRRLAVAEAGGGRRRPWVTPQHREAGRVLKPVLVFVTAVLIPSLASADQVVGAIHTRVREGAAAASPIVYAERLDGQTPAHPGTFTITQKGKAFAPRVLVVPNGSSVTFPNEDPIFHNVFSLSQPQPFDLGLYRAGASKARTFTQPAVYYVFCNIHPQMVAFLVVAPSDWAATAARDGTWRLDLPPGQYRITALSERASPVAIEVTVGKGTTEAPPISLDETVAVVAPHLNKYGKPYPKAAYADK
jgi:plastocyanin